MGTISVMDIDVQVFFYHVIHYYTMYSTSDCVSRIERYFMYLYTSLLVCHGEMVLNVLKSTLVAALHDHICYLLYLGNNGSVSVYIVMKGGRRVKR